MGTEQGNIPFFLDFVIELPPGVEIESEAQAQDCVTWNVSPCDDD